MLTRAYPTTVMPAASQKLAWLPLVPMASHRHLAGARVRRLWRRRQVTLADIAGWAGAALLLLAYARTATGRTATRSLGYRTATLLGSAGHAAWPSVALNSIWLVISIATWSTAPSPTSSTTSDVEDSV
jgi:hypothetical protein